MPNLGNPTNPDGTRSRSQTSAPGSQPNRPGSISRGPGNNKPGKNHLVSSKGKITAEIYAHAIAKVQAGNSSGTGPQKLGNEDATQYDNPAHVYEAQATTSPGTYHNGHPVRKEPAQDFMKKSVGALNTNLHGAKKAAMQTIDHRSSLQKRKDRSARMA